MYVPWKIFGDKVQAIRHVFSPSISLSYKPDFGDPRYGFYEKYTYRNEFGEEVEYSYSPYSRMMFLTAPAGQSGSIGFDFKNNLEMKVKSESDTTGFRKISLIDDFCKLQLQHDGRLHEMEHDQHQRPFEIVEILHFEPGMQPLICMFTNWTRTEGRLRWTNCVFLTAKESENCKVPAVTSYTIYRSYYLPCIYSRFNFHTPFF